jgi:hypothetical protein
VNDLQDTLCSAYGEEAALYAKALDLAEQLALGLRNGDKIDVLLQRLVGVLAEVNAVESQLAGTKLRWQESGQQPDNELRAVLSRLEGLIRSVQEHVQEAEQEARKRQARLTPELDNLIRGRLMRRAYSARS